MTLSVEHCRIHVKVDPVPRSRNDLVGISKTALESGPDAVLKEKRISGF